MKLKNGSEGPDGVLVNIKQTIQPLIKPQRTSH